MSVIVSTRLSSCGLHPDGKAALVFQEFSGSPPSTIHTLIPTQHTLCVIHSRASLCLIHRLRPEAISGKALLLMEWVLLSTQSARTQDIFCPRQTKQPSVSSVCRCALSKRLVPQVMFLPYVTHQSATHTKVSRQKGTHKERCEVPVEV